MYTDERNEDAEDLQAALFARNSFAVTVIGAVAFVGLSVVFLLA